MLNPITDILAKGLPDKTSLVDHLYHVATAAKTIAIEKKMNSKLAWLGGIFHDIGKTHGSFQKRLFYTTQKIIDDNTLNGYLRHEISSLLFLSVVTPPIRDSLIDMIVSHHKSMEKDHIDEIKAKGLLDLIETNGTDFVFQRHSDNWDEWMPQALTILKHLGISVPNKISIDEARQTFEYCISYCEQKNNGVSQWKGLLMGADHFASGLGDKTLTKVDSLFVKPDLSIFHHRKNEKYPLSMKPVSTTHKHSITIAPTGAGKTDFLLRQCKGRIFYTLPFQASLNAMYEKFKQFLPDTDIRLLHASSKMLTNKIDEKLMQRFVGASIKVLTPQQLACLVCATKGFEAIALDIAGCDVILDEIHTYSGITQAIVIEIIKILVELKCKIHIGTATISTALLSELKTILGNIKITKLKSTELKKFNRHTIKKHATVSSALDTIQPALENNQKILYICNTVKRAQQYYILLKETYDVPILLLHSRFKRSDRNKIEQKLFQLEQSDHACIIVSTQVIEVSLDINFDMMITECAPIDSLIQRFGRINRKRLHKTKPIHIIAPSTDTNECLPYTPTVLQKTYDVLKNGLFHETSVQKLVDTIFDTINLKDIQPHINWNKTKELCHNSKSILWDMLNIDSINCILLADQNAYETRPNVSLEIPMSWRITQYKDFKTFGQSEKGHKPFIIPDECYNSEIGYNIDGVDNFL